MKRSTKKGFTLAELLIVIAIIAILIAIMFPVFGAQLNKARAAAELANVRARYSELVADSMLGDESNMTIAENLDVTVDFSVLAQAMQHKASTVTYTAGAEGEEGEIEVVYEGFSGSFKVDADVKFTDSADNELTGETTYYNTGNATPAA